MPRKRGPHLIKPGSTTHVAGERVLATYCGTWVERDDVNEHALNQVRCATCLRLNFRLNSAARGNKPK